MLSRNARTLQGDLQKSWGRVAKKYYLDPFTNPFCHRRMRYFLILLFCCLASAMLAQKPPRVGLTLSGGGAKGLAHIGILEAIDSAGLKIDYITGTSMGSIMGSLYAAGYSGKDIERIARTIDWAALFSGRPSLRNVNIDEKDEVENYALELPLEKGKIKIYSGIIEGQEIWLKFQELLLPVYDVKDFSKLSIPFKCVATDVGTGKAVVLDQGELVAAIRASMAIPSVFTAIDYKDTKLVDGGLVRNFPVKDVVEMGATKVIGVNLSQGLLQAKDLNSAIDVLYQIGFYKDADDFENQRKLCDVYIEPPLKGFSAASFGSSDSLIRIGKMTGDKYYPIFKRMADSLKQLYPDYAFAKERLPKSTYVILDDIRIDGLKRTTRTGFTNRLNLEKGQAYNGVDVAEAIRKVYGSRNYKRITYSWEPTTPGHAVLVFNVLESPLTFLKAALHYNTYSDVALIATVESKNLVFDRSKSTAKVNISENFRMYLEQNQTFGKKENNNLVLSFYHERMGFPVYQDFKNSFLYRTSFTKFDAHIQHNIKSNATYGLGTSLQDINLKPKIAADATVKAGNKFANTYVFYQFNTLDKKNFTTAGWNIYTEAGWVYHQRPSDRYYSNGSIEAFNDSLSFAGYGQIKMRVENYVPLTSRVTLLSQWHAAANIHSDDAYLNFYNVGGITDFVRNQFTFSGLNEFQVTSNSVATLSLGFQYAAFKNIYGIARANAGVYDFSGRKWEGINSHNFLSGYSLTAGYDSGIGPITITIMYSDQAQKVYGYVNVGFHF
jgi:NTE family protein